MRISKKMRLIARVLGKRCCITCRFFNPKTNVCKKSKYGYPSYFFDLRRWKEESGTKFEKIVRIGRTCSEWEGFRLEDLYRRKKDESNRKGENNSKSLGN